MLEAYALLFVIMFATTAAGVYILWVLWRVAKFVWRVTFGLPHKED